MGKKLFYTELAKYYDRIYHYVDYEKQASFFIKLIEKFRKNKNNKILDAACGTGIHADFLQRSGFEVTGLDISKEMLNEASQKNSKVEFLQSDMKEFKTVEKFGTIICFFNSILYNKNPQEMKSTLQNFYTHLDVGGILIFDTLDKSAGVNSKKELYEYKDKDLRISFKPQWILNEKKNILNLEIDFEINNKKLHDHHIMGTFSFNELKNLLNEIVFEVKIFERNFDNIEKYSSGKKAAIFIGLK